MKKFGQIRHKRERHEYREDGDTDYSSERWVELYQAKKQAEADLRAVGGKDE